MSIFHLLGIRAMLSSYDIHQDCTPELLQDICKESGINHLVLLKASEVDYVRVRVFHRKGTWGFFPSKVAGDVPSARVYFFGLLV